MPVSADPTHVPPGSGIDSGHEPGECLRTLTSNDARSAVGSAHETGPDESRGSCCFFSDAWVHRIRSAQHAVEPGSFA